jgi:hypothetical protein
LPVIENFIWIEPLLRGHLCYKATFSLSQWWPLNTSLTVYDKHNNNNFVNLVDIKCSILPYKHVIIYILCFYRTDMHSIKPYLPINMFRRITHPLFNPYPTKFISQITVCTCMLSKFPQHLIDQYIIISNFAFQILCFSMSTIPFYLMSRMPL